MPNFDYKNLIPILHACEYAHEIPGSLNAYMKKKNLKSLTNFRLNNYFV